MASGSARVRVDDANIGVDDRGSGDAIVLLHGFPLTHAMWAAQAGTLSRTHRVIRPDLRGVGASSAPGGPYLMESLAADIAGVLDALGVPTATIVGHSLGGYVAMAFARMFAERVERLALICSKLRADTAEEANKRNQLADRIETENSIVPAIEAYLPRIFAAQTYVNDPALVERVRAQAELVTPRGAAALIRGMALRGAADDIAADLPMPVLVVAGAGDQFVPEAESRATVAAFANARLEICSASGHLPPLEEPERVSTLLGELVSASA
jgi:pimeloyl-ACP methyl ester carboxylesterase